MDDKDRLIDILTMENARLREDNRYYVSELDSFRNGEAQKKINKTHAEELATRDKRIEELERENRELLAAVSHNRDMWFEQFEIEKKEFEKKLAKEAQAKEAAEKSRDAAEAYALKKDKENIALRAEVKDLKRQHKDDLKTITALNNKIERMNLKTRKRDSTTSSNPSSHDPNHEKLSNNSRVRTGNHVGAQPGHEHHGRKTRTPDKVVNVPASEKFSDASKYTPTGNKVRRQVMGYVFIPYVIEYVANEYKDRRTGKLVHDDFPQGVDNDVNYDERVKALAFLLNNKYNVAVNKVQEFFKEFLGGMVPSTGWINQLSREFSEKSEDERNEIFKDLVNAEILHGDYTFMRENGKVKPIVVTYANHKMLFQRRDHRGYEGLKGTPVDYNDNILVCDGEYALANLKSSDKNAQCWAHFQRHINDCMNVEPFRRCLKDLKDWSSEAIHYADEVRRGKEPCSKAKVQEYLDRLDRIIEDALEEYRKNPPGIFTKGQKLFERLKRDKERFTLFLTNLDVPPTNNICEYGARKVKRKAAVCRTFRSMSGTYRFCNSLTILETSKLSGENVYDKTIEIFKKQKK